MANVAEGSTFNFQRFLTRAFDVDFEQVVGIRLWIWMLSLLFMFFSAQEFYNYYWLPFIPLLLVLAVGTKLETIITKMCVESSKNSSVTRGTFLVKPSNEYFWFQRPQLLLHLLQFILIQNSFQLAFFTWAWYEYGLRSCFNKEIEDVVIRITTGMGVQFLCGYVTLPIYALVTQMGANMKKAVFTERVTKGLKHWHWKAKHHLSNNLSTWKKHENPPLPLPFTSNQNNSAKQEEEDFITCSKQEITTKENSLSLSLRTMTSMDLDNDEDEISFASSWKNMGSSGVGGEISMIKEEEEGGGGGGNNGRPNILLDEYVHNSVWSVISVYNYNSMYQSN